MPIVITPTKKKKTPMPKARPKSLKADKTESLDKKFSAGVSATNKKNMQNVKKKKDGGKLKKKEKMFSMKGSKGQGQSVKPFGLTRVRDTKSPLGSSLMVTPTDPIVRKSPDSLTNRKKKLEAKKKKDAMKKAGGGKLKSIPEGNKGLSKLPTPVRNKMGFMKKGGKVTKMRGGGAATRGMNFNRGY